MWRETVKNLYSVKGLEKLTFDKEETEFIKLYRNTKILIIDDEEPKSLIKALDKFEFIVEHKKQFKSFDELKEFDIFIVDIKGVSKDLSSDGEGAYLSKLIKDTFTNKRIYIYTGATHDKSYNQYFKVVDAVFAKNQSEELIADITNYVQNLDNVVEQWYGYREELIKQNIETKIIALIEHYYVKAILKRENNIFDHNVNKILKLNTDRELNEHLMKISKFIFMIISLL